MRVYPPTRVRHTYVQNLVGPPEAVFPLLCPVRELEWASGWAPRWVAAHTGLCEPDCVFVTPGEPADAIWYVTRHEPEAGFVEMLKITPGVTACRLTIQLRPSATGCEAEVTYCHTSLGPAGDAFVAAFTEDYYRQFMVEWEAELNEFLRGAARP